ncbi:MAG: hypothetical protein WCW44_03810 [archaeon]|jgi:hypothetical protein
MVKHQPKDLESFIFKALAQNTELKSALFKGILSVDEIAIRIISGYDLKTTPAFVKEIVQKYKENCLLR